MSPRQAGASASATPSAYFTVKIVRLRTSGITLPGRVTRPAARSIRTPSSRVVRQPIARPATRQAAQAAANSGDPSERVARLPIPQAMKTAGTINSRATGRICGRADVAELAAWRHAPHSGCVIVARILFWRRPRINVVELHGLISPRPGLLSAATVGPLIDRAFRTAQRQPVILDIESPGGSPVQSDLIASLIRRRAEQYKVRVVAAIREVGASGGYWLACAADEIHANPMSIVGSIGVRGGGFGFPDLLARFGVERRLYTAGANKARLDPFRPEDPEDVAFIQDLLDALHVRFKDWVRTRRGDRLKGDEAALFDGGFMLGERALQAGLIDGLNDVDSLVRALGGERAVARRFAPRRRGMLRLLPRLAVDAALDAVEERRSRIEF